MQPYCRQDRTQARRLLCLVRRKVQRARRIVIPLLVELETPPRVPSVWRRRVA